MTNDWQIEYKNTQSSDAESYGQESLLTLGNGYLGWRGAPIMSTFNENHYPGLYVAGVFNQTTTPLAGKNIINEDLVNLPNPQLLELEIDDQKIDFNPIIRDSILNMKDGTLTEKCIFQLVQGNVQVTTTKAVDPIHYHQFVEHIEVITDFNASLKASAIIDGTITNQNVKRYRDFNSQEFQVIETNNHYLHARTLTSKIDLVVGATLHSNRFSTQTNYQSQKVVDTITAAMIPGEPLIMDRVMAVATSYEDNSPITTVLQSLNRANYNKILNTSQSYWQKIWSTNDIQVKSTTKDLQKLIRLNIFHLHQAAQHNANQYLDASVGSRALTGEGYRGHIFWDELFVIPYYTANEPETAYDILQYRLKRLTAAKNNAALENEAGAMYPWQSGMYGDEQAQIIHLNPVDNSWIPDNSRLQRHVSLAIIYNLWIYTHLTNDYRLLNNGGLNVLMETSKFWLNKVHLEDGKYHLTGIMGPDEFHEAYPNANTAGIRDNAYTNIMLTWSLNWLLSLKSNPQVNFNEIATKTHFDTALLQKAYNVANNLALYVNQQGVVEQYAGYFDLKEIDFAAYTKKYGDIHRIDRILKAEGKSSNDYQANKQADFLMLIYNLGVKATEKLINQLGYQLPPNWLTANRDYYLARTVHGSTTSRPVFSGIDVILGDNQRATEFLETAIKSDYDDIQGGTTAEGIHIGVMGETLATIQTNFAGVDLRGNQITINPQLPKSWQRLCFTQRFRGVLFNFNLTNKSVIIKTDQDTKINIQGKEINLKQGQSQTVELAERNK